MYVLYHSILFIRTPFCAMHTHMYMSLCVHIHVYICISVRTIAYNCCKNSYVHLSLSLLLHVCLRYVYSYIYIYSYSYIYIYMKPENLSRVRHIRPNSFEGRMHRCGVTPSSARHDTFAWVTWLVQIHIFPRLYMHDMTPVYMRMA